MPAERRTIRMAAKPRREFQGLSKHELTIVSQKQSLQTSLAITPKTAGLLFDLGYRNYRELRGMTPDALVAQFANLPGLNTKTAKQYRRATRRMVWLATQENPFEQAKTCPDWTEKGLTAKGIWTAEFDSLTGDQINDRMEAQGVSRRKVATVIDLTS